MTTIADAVGEQALRFFGSTTASVSHELKNALAIIKENAGLLNDYMLMMDKGRPVEPQRFKTVAGRIEDQIFRADGLIKSLNRYAHTVDDDTKELDLNEILDLFASVSHRSAAMRQVTLQCLPAAHPVMAHCPPFLLFTALGQCLSFALDLAVPGQNMIVGISTEQGGGFYFQLPTAFSQSCLSQYYPNPEQEELLSRLGASSAMEAGAGRITITLNAT